MLKIMKVLYDCGSISNEEIDRMDLDFSVIDSLLRKEQLIAKSNGKTVLYSLTDFGEKIYRMETDKKLFFRCSNSSKKKALVAFYSNLSTEERDTWKSKDSWYFEGYVGAVPDATYLKDGKMYGVFVQTNNTVKPSIEQIEKFVKERNIENIYYIRA